MSPKGPSRDSIVKEVIDLFVKHAKTDVSVNVGSDIYADLGIDSAVAMEVVAEVEDRYDFIVPDGKLQEIRTVGDVIRIAENEL